MSRDPAALAARSISLSFGGVAALRDVSLTMAAGSITGLVGPNGAGKTTLFNVLAGTLRPDTGQVLLAGQDITRRAPWKRSRQGIARTFQMARELDSLSLLENLLLAWPDHPGDSLWRVLIDWGSVRRAEGQAMEKALALLRRVRLEALADQPAGSLSGGQKKLLELCRALMQDPRVLLLDEPAAGVSPALIEELTGFILSLRDEGRTLAIVEHNMQLISALCDSVYVLAEGEVLIHGSFEEAMADPRVTQAYLGSIGEAVP